MRNHRTKAVGTKLGKTKSSNSRRGSLLPASQPKKRQRCYQEIEVYHRLYKEKINALTEEALAKNPLPADDVTTSDTDDEQHQGSDDDGHDDPSTKNKTKSTNNKAYRMKIKREVRAQAWADETREVKEEIHQLLEREKEDKIKQDKALICNEKSGLERPSEQRQL